jgi:ribonuclease BN (tRNA processing enzyme)
MMLNRNIFPVTAVSFLLSITACQAPQDPPFAKIVPSATVEERLEPSQAELDAPTQVVVLGTGTPIPDATRAGTSIAVIHRGEAYLFDVGAGSIQNAVKARYRYDIPSLYPHQICCVFVTHLHNDHTADYAELANVLWWRRRQPLRAWGPAGLDAMTEGMYAMMAPDIAIRTSGNQPVRNPHAYKVDVAEISDGIVFENDGLTVEAFSVNHGEVKPAFGYKVTTPDKSIVISGDTAYSETLIDQSRGVDILFHEVISDKGLATTSPGFQAYHRKSHTPASELGRLASIARPELLVLVHVLYYGMPEDLIVKEVSSTYDGKVVLADDLDRF